MFVHNTELLRCYALVNEELTMIDNTLREIPKFWQDLGAVGALFLIVIIFLWILNRLITNQQRHEASDDTLTRGITELMTGMLGLLKTANESNAKLGQSIDGLTEQTKQNCMTLGNLITITQNAIKDMDTKSSEHSARLVTLEATTKTVFEAIEKQLGEMKTTTAEALSDIKVNIMSQLTQSNGDAEKIKALLTESLEKQKEATELLKAMIDKQKPVDAPSDVVSGVPGASDVLQDKPVSTDTPPDEK